MSRNSHTTEELRSLVAQWLNEKLREDITEFRIARRQGLRPPNPDLGKSREDLETLSLVASDFCDDLRFAPRGRAKEVYREWEPLAADIASKAGIDFVTMSPASQERLIAFTISAESRRYEKLSGGSPDFMLDLWDETVPTASPRPVEPAAPGQGSDSVTLEEAWKRYEKEQRTRGAKGWEDGAPVHALWLQQDIYELFGADRPVESIAREDILLYRDTLQTRYPRDRNKARLYRDKDLKQLASGPEIPVESRIADGTKQSRLGHLKRFFGFQKDHGLRQDDPSAAAQISSSDGGRGEAWTHSEIEQILTAPALHRQFTTENKHFCPGGLFWLLAVLAHTGARQREIMGLRFEDFDLDSQHPVLIIRPTPDRPLKTKQAERWVPIHRHLIALGLPEWIDHRKRLKAVAPWPCTGRSPDYWGRVFKERITEKLGLHQHRAKNMHSFRHSFISAMVGQQVPEDYRRLIAGHKGSGIDWDHYIHQIDQYKPQFSEFVNRVDYGLDLDGLKELWRASMGEGRR